jgi:hypothetical protein
MLDWKFLADGSEKHGWTADSAFHCEDTPLKWDIAVNDAGLFVVGGSASGFTDRKEIFETLAATKAWCQRIEATVVEAFTKPIASLPVEAINTIEEILRQIAASITAEIMAEEDAKFLQAVFKAVDTSTAEEAKKAVTFDDCSPEVEAAAAKAINEFVEEATKDALPRPFSFVILRTGNPYFDGKAAALLGTDCDSRKHHVRVENGNITWVDLVCLSARRI